MIPEYYCVGQCHQGTDIAMFRSGPLDEKLTFEEAKQFANKHGRGHYFFDCTPDEYYAQGELV
jgi:(2Fe-2S) ferredoxin